MTAPSRASWLHWLGCGAILALSLLLYLDRLDVAPVYIGGDEAHFANHGHSIATTGRDLNGTRLPLFIQITDLLVQNSSTRVWYQPTLFYMLAATFTVLPVNEYTVRLPTALLGVLNVVLVYLVARKLFDRARYALLAALMMALMPAHFLVSRQALDYICPLPVVLGWSWCVLEYLRSREPRALVLAALLLGAGVYTYIASWALMPLLALATLAIVKPTRAAVAKAAVAFMLPPLLVVPWVWSRPQILADTLLRYRVPGAASAVPDARATTSLLDFELGERVSMYWDYFNPSFLFFAGGSNPTLATGRAGVFLLPMAVFLAIGLFVLLRRRAASDLVPLVVFLTAPLPLVAALPAKEYSIARALTMLPAAALIAAAGMRHMLDQPSLLWRGAGIALLIAIPVQFTAFHRDYFGDYQLRAAYRFDPIATREIMTTVAALDARDGISTIYFQDDLDDKAVRWRFLALTRGRMDLWERSRYFDLQRSDPATLPPGSLLIMYTGDSRRERLLSSAGFELIAEVPTVSGGPAASILRRVSTPSTR
jgi:4-amino-4-deoxy-L-arabinose transferase-like glycosyltransferase